VRASSTLPAVRRPRPLQRHRAGHQHEDRRGSRDRSTGYGFNVLIVRKDLVTSGRYKTLADLKGMKFAEPVR